MVTFLVTFEVSSAHRMQRTAGVGCIIIVLVIHKSTKIFNLKILYLPICHICIYLSIAYPFLFIYPHIFFTYPFKYL